MSLDDYPVIPPRLLLVWSALFAALTILGAYLAIPFYPVPFVLANMIPLLAGLMLGPWPAMGSVLIYLALGALGLPVFAGGNGGFPHFLGPTGGFLLGYLLSAGISGFARTWARGRLGLLLAVSLGILVQYIPGILVFDLVIESRNFWESALYLSQFLPGDVVKALSVVVLAAILLPHVKDRLQAEEQEHIEEISVENQDSIE